MLIGTYVENVHLSTVLSVFTGAESLPPMGVGMAPVLRFDPSNMFPTASTCALEFTLYHNQPHLFKEKMVYAFKNHGGFGMY